MPSDNYGSGPAPIVLQLRLDHAAQSIVHHLALHQTEIEQYLKIEVKKALTLINFQELIQKEIHTIFHKCIQDYFNYGKGNRYISEAVNKILQKTFENGEIK